MNTEVLIPEFSESVSEGTVGAWLKQVGDEVKEGETLVEVETDKVVLEIPAPVDGVLEKIIKAKNEVVSSKEVVAILKTVNLGQGQTTQVPNKEDLAAEPDNEKKSDSLDEDSGQQVKKSPAVRKLLHENEVDLDTIDPSGKGNRITKEDVLKSLDAVSDKMESSRPAVIDHEDQRVAMSSLRKRIAQRLVSAQQEYAMLTTFNEVNMQRVLEIRERYKDRFKEQYGSKLGFMSFFVLAAVDALREYPIVNASVDHEEIIYHSHVDMGIAVSSERGLVVPVIRNTESKTMAAVEIEINELASKAKQNKLSIDELTGGTFTITNGGVFGSMMSTPIINPPQSAIMGMHAIEKRPVVENDEVVVRPMMYLALSYDHRIIDGREAVLFLSRIKKIIEDPVQLLLHL